MQSAKPRWDWNGPKADRNLIKHRISFELAVLALEDPNQLSQMDEDTSEHRYRTLAMIDDVIVLIVHTEPEIETYTGQFVGRIISARLALPTERRAYHNA